MKHITEEKLESICDIEMQFQRVLVEMEINGISVDIDKWRKFEDDCGNILYGIESDMLNVFNLCHNVSCNLFGEKICDSPINFGSSNQLLNCIQSLGFVVDVKTAKGNPSVGKEYLQKMLGEHEFFDLLWRYRKLQKLHSSFLKPLDNFIDSDGRIRPSYNLVRTGRLSCSKPNLQQLPNPKKEKLEFNHRELFIPKKGHVLIKADYSGQELRVLGEVSSDKFMLGAFENGYDLHLFTANRVFDLSLPDEAFIDGTEAHNEACSTNKQKRHQAKNGVNFPIIYGATAGRIAKDNKVSKKEASRWLNEFFKLYPGVKRAIDKIPDELARQGYVQTLFGRKRRFPEYAKSRLSQEKAAMERQAFNMKIQGTSADIGKLAGIMLLERLPGYAKLILFVHDEWVTECPEDKAEDVKKIMVDCLENAAALRVKMVVEAKIVRNFGE